MPVVVLVNEIKNAAALIWWAGLLAKAKDAKVHALLTETGQKQSKDLDPNSSDLSPLASEIAQTAGAQSLDISIRQLVSPQLDQAILDELGRVAADFLVLPRSEPGEHRNAQSELRQKLFQNAPCPTILLRCGREVPLRCSKILVPTAGGPNAHFALHMATTMVDDDGQIDALFVEPPIGHDAEWVGKNILDRAIQGPFEKNGDRIQPKVTVARSIYEGIELAERENAYDLMLIGASRHGAIHRFVFGTIPDKVIAEPGGPSMAVVRAALPMTTRAQRWVNRFLNATVPQVSRPERLDLYERIQSSSKWNFDFIALICLSTLIAGLGLIRNAASVVIGAMLVAPLMTPLVGSGLALVQGNLLLIRQTAKSVLFGFCLAFGIGFLLGLIVPRMVVTPEMISRGSPNVLDLAVAFASGMAAAYATARPNLSAVLPGVAIAAALIPPIATSGICLAVGEPVVAAGSALLFLTNIVAIVIGAAIALYSVGIRHGAEGKRWAKRASLIMLVVVNILAIPLGYLLYDQLPQKAVPESVIQTIDQRIGQMPGARRVSIDHMPDEAGDEVIHITIETAALPSEKLTEDLAAIASAHYQKPTRVRVISRLVHEARKQ